MLEGEPVPQQPVALERKLRVVKESNVAGSMLRSIEANAQAAFEAERGIISTTQPDLHRYLEWNINPDGNVNWVKDRSREQYMRGALAAYRILRTQSEQDGAQVPQISPTIVDAFIADKREMIRDEEAKAGDRLPGEDARRMQADELAKVDPELDRAIRDLTRFEVSNGDARLGAYEVSTLLNKALDAKELEAAVGPIDIQDS